MLTLTGALLLFSVLTLPAQADAPASPAGFAAPTAIANAYTPFSPGSVSLYHGRNAGRRAVILVNHLSETRVFPFDGQLVECCILEAKEFDDGALVEIAVNYLAQDDAGAVWSFGEVSVEYADGVIVGPEEDSWIVGGSTAVGDPAGIHAPEQPALFMPAELHLGTTFQMENYGDPDETITVVSTSAKLRVPAGRFAEAVKLKETHDDEPGPPEQRWVVAGLGVVQDRSKGAWSQLIATSMSPAPPVTDGD